MKTSRRFNFIGIFLLTFVAGCASTPSTYTVRGVVVRSVAAEQHRGIVVLHEAIDDFRGRDGQKSRMEVMAMGFAVEKHIPVQAFLPEDKVELNFKVDWNREPSLIVTEIMRLPPSTELELEGFSVEPME